MFFPRLICAARTLSDEDGLKLYTVSARGGPVDESQFDAELRRLKSLSALDWADTPAFAILHDGESALYLVLAWWANGNELFTRVSVRTPAGWQVDPNRYSFCLWDLEIMWFERTAFITHLYSGEPNLAAYREARLQESARL